MSSNQFYIRIKRYYRVEFRSSQHEYDFIQITVNILEIQSRLMIMKIKNNALMFQ